MISIPCFFANEYEELNKRVTKYINSVLTGIVETSIDWLEDAKSVNEGDISDCLKFLCPPALVRRDPQLCENRIYELRELLSSPVVRRRIKPIYQYILFRSIEDYLTVVYDAAKVGEVIDAFPMDAELKHDIVTQFGAEGEEAIGYITDIDGYLDTVFSDWDFLPEFLNRLVALSMDNPSVFQMAMTYEELDDFIDLMDVDLRDNYTKYRATMTQSAPPEEFKLLDNVLRAVYTIQQNRRYYGKTENEINDGMRDILNMVYIVKDQTRHGESEVGEDAGEVDFLILEKDCPVAIMEALKLRSMNTAYLKRHIEKAVLSYDPVGYPNIFVLIYCSAADFHAFWIKCTHYLKEYEFPFPISEDILEIPLPYAETKLAILVLNRNGNPVIVHFIAAHMR